MPATLPAALYMSNNARTEGEQKQAFEDILLALRVSLQDDGNPLGPIHPHHGQCRMGYVGATSIKLSPFNGNKILVKDGTGWKLRTVPSAGITAANTNVHVDGAAGQNLAATTNYLVCLFDDSGALKLDFRTTLTIADDADTGVKIATTTPTRTVVGAVRTNASSQFEDSETARHVRSWFNRRRLRLRNKFTTTKTTASTSYVDLSSTEGRVSMLIWPEEVITAHIAGFHSINSSSEGLWTALGVDITTGLYYSEVKHIPVSSTTDKGLALTEVHVTPGGLNNIFMTILGHVSGTATGSWFAPTAITVVIG